MDIEPQIEAFLNETSEMYKETAIPPCPLCLCNLVTFCAVAGCMNYCSSVRVKKVAKSVQKFNQGMVEIGKGHIYMKPVVGYDYAVANHMRKTYMDDEVIFAIDINVKAATIHQWCERKNIKIPSFLMRSTNPVVPSRGAKKSDTWTTWDCTLNDAYCQ